jgi:Fic family protein
LNRPRIWDLDHTWFRTILIKPEMCSILIEEVFTQPYCRIDNVVQRGIAKRQTTSRYLKMLAEMGVLEERKIGREKLFVNPKLLSLLADEGETQ